MKMGTGTGSRVLSHQLSNGLYVSGARDQYRGRQPTMTVTAMPYTGGDVKKSGELGKMFDIPVEAPKSKRSGPIAGGGPHTGFFRSASSNSASLPGNNPTRSDYSTFGPLNSAGAPWQASNKTSSQILMSGPLTGTGTAGNRQRSHSGPLSRMGDPAAAGIARSLKTSSPLSSAGTAGITRQNSGSLAPNLPATGLITSGPISSGPLSSSGDPRKYSGPIETGGLGKSSRRSVANNQAVNKLSHDSLLTWNACWAKRAVTGFVDSFPDIGLNNVKDGQYVKVTGVVTCGSIPLKTSFQKVNRCVYTSTKLYEYRGFGAKPARPNHRFFTWGLRHLECHVVDFYISDFQSGLRALVKTGYSTSVIPYVKDSIVVDITKKKEDLQPNFLRWLAERNLSSNDNVMRLKESYIKEGSTVTVMGVVQRNENVLMIVPPPEPVSTGCQLGRFLLPAKVEGIILRCDDSSQIDVIPV